MYYIFDQERIMVNIKLGKEFVICSSTLSDGLDDAHLEYEKLKRLVILFSNIFTGCNWCKMADF